ncbi:OLC1v1019371C1 [Oldenlandia corymbosa var. corymbosa]|uniref:OLC1v1019371C1 n=1 Tax=Oldenlandia corymbosa var. corymbosa TaxID=529605 RepID=A0AAV1EDW3_OLDCO|nr:OLC1v1019371C1 [Oldenlandia corymbosa var. corymbosa]
MAHPMTTRWFRSASRNSALASRSILSGFSEIPFHRLSSVLVQIFVSSGNQPSIAIEKKKIVPVRFRSRETGNRISVANEKNIEVVDVPSLFANGNKDCDDVMDEVRRITESKNSTKQLKLDQLVHLVCKLNGTVQKLKSENDEVKFKMDKVNDLLGKRGVDAASLICFNMDLRTADMNFEAKVADLPRRGSYEFPRT